MSFVINCTRAASQKFKYFKFDSACNACFNRNNLDQELNRIVDTQPGCLSNQLKVEGPLPIKNIKDA